MPNYPIKREFFPYSKMNAPLLSPRMAGVLGSMMRPPHWIFRDKEVDLFRVHCPSVGGDEVELLCLTPRGVTTDAALLYYHGGGFVFGAAGYHYRLAKEYALRAKCCVLFVQYRLAPRYPYPIPVEDCFNALRWTVNNALRLGISEDKIAVAGDSAGGALAAAVSLMARDRMGFTPRFQMLIYPVLDRRMQSESMRTYTDTPMWNSVMNHMMWDSYLPFPGWGNITYASPAEAHSLRDLPPTYIEVAQFDCLRDEGIAYAHALRRAGVLTCLCRTKGTMHAYDIADSARTTRVAVARRIKYMREKFALS